MTSKPDGRRRSVRCGLDASRYSRVYSLISSWPSLPRDRSPCRNAAKHKARATARSGLPVLALRGVEHYGMGVELRRSVAIDGPSRVVLKGRGGELAGRFRGMDVADAGLGTNSAAPTQTPGRGMSAPDRLRELWRKASAWKDLCPQVDRSRLRVTDAFQTDTQSDRLGHQALMEHSTFHRSGWKFSLSLNQRSVRS
jgi:hypothetical protein